MSDHREGFFGRWSRLKQSQRQNAEADAAAKPEDTDAPVGSPPDAPGEVPAESPDRSESPAPDLPPIESLDKDSDFTAFLKEGVPEDVQRLALRKLWRSDPVLANLDGLLEYGEDFNEPWRTNTVIKTLYQVGRGMPGLFEEASETGADEAETTGAGAEAPAATSEGPAETEEAGEAEEASEAAAAEGQEGEGDRLTAPRTRGPERQP